mmetsp:Transcript_12740/g.28109  ORF Transcript_12740/g.28109 Transcript_12740/m.28109 type:complete len:133 (+) Transcript_12740:497-895(+)
MFYPHLLRFDGTYETRKVFESLANLAFEARRPGSANFYGFDSHIGGGGYGSDLWTYVNDDEARVRAVAGNDGVYPEIIGPDFGSGGVEAHNSFLGVDLAEHSEHGFQIIVVQIKHGLNKLISVRENSVQMMK